MHTGVGTGEFFRIVFPGGENQCNIVKSKAQQLTGIWSAAVFFYIEIFYKNPRAGWF